MMEAAEYILVIEKRTGLKIGCIEEIAYREGFIDANKLKEVAKDLVKSGYGEYLENLFNS